MRIAVCDDEEASRELLKRYIGEWASEKKISAEVVSFANAESFLFAWEDDARYDLLILDIEMGKLNGVELARRLRGRGEEIPILFITGYDRYMAEGYEVAALHYLLKPLRRERLFLALDRFLRTGIREQKLLFAAEEGSLAVFPSDIWYVEADGHRCILKVGARAFVLRQSISEAARLLDGRGEFVRCHRSYVVNLRHVSAVLRPELVLDDGTRLPVSRSAYRQVNEAFIRNYVYRTQEMGK